MQLFSKPSSKTFCLLSVGQRGVGKTVFLAGSYAQLQQHSPRLAVKGSEPSNDRSFNRSEAFEFECQDEEMQMNLEKILHHVEQTGLYPPATIKITNFNFRLNQHTVEGRKTICNFRWWDIPGEFCDLRNPEFQEIVINSHGCCVFISADKLVHDRDYIQTVDDIFNQVVAIASLIYQHGLNYAIALILTKCDLLAPGSEAKLQQNLEPFIARLEPIKANYRQFNSAIPIVSRQDVFMLDTAGVASPLLWLLSELNQQHRFQPERNLASSFTQPGSHQLSQRFSSRSLSRSPGLIALVLIAFLGLVASLLFRLIVLKPTPAQPPTQQQRTYP